MIYQPDIGALEGILARHQYLTKSAKSNERTQKPIRQYVDDPIMSLWKGSRGTDCTKTEAAPLTQPCSQERLANPMPVGNRTIIERSSLGSNEGWRSNAHTHKKETLADVRRE